jgi:hypothetical protein
VMLLYLSILMVPPKKTMFVITGNVPRIFVMQMMIWICKMINSPYQLLSRIRHIYWRTPQIIFLNKASTYSNLWGHGMPCAYTKMRPYELRKVSKVHWGWDILINIMKREDWVLISTEKHAHNGSKTKIY